MATSSSLQELSDTNNSSLFLSTSAKKSTVGGYARQISSHQSLPDRDVIYRMSECEEEKSEFEKTISPRVLPPSVSFRNSTIIDSPETGATVKLSLAAAGESSSILDTKSPPLTFRTKSGRGASFKRDISAKFIDITTHDRKCFF